VKKPSVIELCYPRADSGAVGLLIV